MNWQSSRRTFHHSMQDCSVPARGIACRPSCLSRPSYNHVKASDRSLCTLLKRRTPKKKNTKLPRAQSTGYWNTVTLVMRIWGGSGHSRPGGGTPYRKHKRITITACRPSTCTSSNRVRSGD
ncbi:hypothetical protein M407DRAFT_106943 [Tulasnella calospora MUT 4182]|uniref:Uncharacterized protein n=1 Tax=Tulasnella calospora MUT 4182 TaxID=1051891 RepID=A0A0C3QDP1_9AGAM|nr:hypothetical protein M407DRAFT_106943 [Tulasnella calospora MUT 4182]